jgi:hypothetical protein
LVHSIVLALTASPSPEPAAQSNSSFLNFMYGIAAGLAAAMVAWLGTMLFFSPRVHIRGRFEGSAYQVLVHSRRWLRTLVDVEVTCELHVPHGNKERNELTLKTSTNRWPRVAHGWEGIITISMDPASLTDFGKARLAERLNELNPPKQLARSVPCLRFLV